MISIMFILLLVVVFFLFCVHHGSEADRKQEEIMNSKK